MAKVVVNNSLTLDGVMQAPGRPDEDTRGGFKHGGWAAAYFDPVMRSRIFCSRTAPESICSRTERGKKPQSTTQNTMASKMGQ